MARAQWSVSVGGAGPCVRCGADAWRPTRRPLLRRVWGWMRFGFPINRVDIICGSCGEEGGGMYSALHRARPGWWWLPVQLVSVIRAERSMEPVPITYLAAAVAATVAGVAAQIVLGWPWWVVAAALVVAVWLFFMSSALWGSSNGRREVARLLAPRRAARHDVAERVEEMSATGRTMCGVANWPGELGLGGVVGYGPGADRVLLVHGDRRGDGPLVEVTMADRLDAHQARARAELADPVAAWNSPRGARPRHGPDPVWTSRRFVVQDAEVAFAFLESGTVWAAVRAIGGDEIRVVARNVPPENVSLTLVKDLTPYANAELHRIANSTPQRHGPWV